MRRVEGEKKEKKKKKIRVNETRTRCKSSEKINKFPPSFSPSHYVMDYSQKMREQQYGGGGGEVKVSYAAELILACSMRTSRGFLWVDVEGVRWWIWRVRSESMRNETGSSVESTCACCCCFLRCCWELDYKAEIKILLILARAYGSVFSFVKHFKLSLSTSSERS